MGCVNNSGTEGFLWTCFVFVVFFLGKGLIRGTEYHRESRGLTGDIGLSTAKSASEDRLVGLVVKASASRAEDPGFESRLRWDFFGVESYQ